MHPIATSQLNPGPEPFLHSRVAFALAGDRHRHPFKRKGDRDELGSG